jgi:hypothetical protein
MKVEKLTSQFFWDQMDGVEVDALRSEASEVDEIACRVENGRYVTNWIGIHHSAGQATDVAVVSEVSPWYVTGAELALQRRGTVLGDVNLDYSLDISDPIMLLGDLFLARQAVVCWAAADFNQDGRVLIADPIAMLQHLFAGAARTLERDVFCDAPAE